MSRAGNADFRVFGKMVWKDVVKVGLYDWKKKKRLLEIVYRTLGTLYLFTCSSICQSKLPNVGVSCHSSFHI